MDVTVPRTLPFCDLGSLRHVVGTGSLGEARRVTVNSIGCCQQLLQGCLWPAQWETVW